MAKSRCFVPCLSITLVWFGIWLVLSFEPPGPRGVVCPWVHAFMRVCGKLRGVLIHLAITFIPVVRFKSFEVVWGGMPVVVKIPTGDFLYFHWQTFRAANFNVIFLNHLCTCNTVRLCCCWLSSKVSRNLYWLRQVTTFIHLKLFSAVRKFPKVLMAPHTFFQANIM